MLNVGLQVVGSLTQHIDPDAQTYLGPGKLQELLQLVANSRADTVIFDGELSPRQLRNISRQCSQQTRICDRTALILDIFKQRAFTKEGQLQVIKARYACSIAALSSGNAMQSMHFMFCIFNSSFHWHVHGPL